MAKPLHSNFVISCVVHNFPFYCLRRNLPQIKRTGTTIVRYSINVYENNKLYRSPRDILPRWFRGASRRKLANVCTSMLASGLIAANTRYTNNTNHPIDIINKNSNLEKSNTVSNSFSSKFCNAIKIFARFLKVALTFFPTVCLFPCYFIGPTWRQFWWTALLWSVENSGPIFIKFGQWASTRRDLFPKEFCDLFSRLQRHVKPHSWYFTTRQLDDAFGENWRDFIPVVDNDNRPVGSGCVAQVYKAYLGKRFLRDAAIANRMDSLQYEKESWKRILIEKLELFGVWKIFGVRDSRLEKLKSTGAFDTELIPVAIKVLHPSIRSLLYKDLVLMQFFARLLENLFPSLKWLKLSMCVNEFSQHMSNQVNLVKEAKNLDVFSENFKEISDVRFPKPLWPFVTKDVLVETFEDGENMLEYTSGVKGNDSNDILANIGADAVLKMVFVDNFVHGDLHPGNIIVQKKDEQEKALEKSKFRISDLVSSKMSKESFRLVFLDCSLASSLEKKDYNNFLGVFRAVVFGKGEEVAELFLAHSEHDCSDSKGFVVAMSELITTARKNTICLEKMEVADLITNLFNVLSTYRVRLESNFITIILAMVIVEGLGRSLNPNLDLLEKAKFYFLK